MLMPRKVRHRKTQRGRMTGLSKGGTRVTFGDSSIHEGLFDCRRGIQQTQCIGDCHTTLSHTCRNGLMRHFEFF